MASIPGLGGFRAGDYFYFLSLVLVMGCIYILQRITDSPFGRLLTTIRENPERASFIGVNVRQYELAAFVISGAFAGSLAYTSPGRITEGTLSPADDTWALAGCLYFAVTGQAPYAAVVAAIPRRPAPTSPPTPARSTPCSPTPPAASTEASKAPRRHEKGGPTPSLRHFGTRSSAHRPLRGRRRPPPLRRRRRGGPHRGRRPRRTGRTSCRNSLCGRRHARRVDHDGRQPHRRHSTGIRTCTRQELLS